MCYVRDVSGQQMSEGKTEGALDPCSVGPLARVRSRKTKPSSAPVQQPPEVMTADASNIISH